MAAQQDSSPRSDIDWLKDVMETRFASVGDRFAAVERETARALSAIQAETASALKYSEKAVEKAEMASEKRFEGVNEFRAALNDNARLLMPRVEAEQRFNGLSDKIDVLTKKVSDRDQQKIGAGNIWAYIVGAIGALSILWSVASTLLKAH